MSGKERKRRRPIADFALEVNCHNCVRREIERANVPAEGAKCQ
uniref:Uncharacterized protein n=1 Tax=Ralstonia solanacearum TaxID=305 RepID=A0A0S4UKZ5_RALSL|nr:protein of unknown function [Ralstonia solanacearum]